MPRTSKQQAMFERSGEFRSQSRLVSFLYLLMRDRVPPGRLEGILNDISADDATLTNGWLGRYAQDLASRLVPESSAVEGGDVPEYPISDSELERWICEAFNCQAPDHTQCPTRTKADLIATRRLVERAIAYAFGR